MTGIASNTTINMNLSQSANIVLEENARVAKLININEAARTTTIKPSGTTSTVLGTSSGIHAWHNDYYIRRIRVMKNDALYTYLSIYHPELIEDDIVRSHDTAIIKIPQMAPEGSILRTETAIDLLERVKRFNLEWVRKGHRKGANTNNVSATISIDKNKKYIWRSEVPIRAAGFIDFEVDEWKIVGEWMWNNKDSFNGLSVLPYSDHSYIQAPFEDCTKEDYDRLMKDLVSVDLTKVVELDDNTDLQGELACQGNSCEIK